MFTGIAQGIFKVSQVQAIVGAVHYAIQLSPELTEGLRVGASVSVDGVCQTVVQIVTQAEGVHGGQVFFDAIQETLDRTTLRFLEAGRSVNIERSARFGDEVGGHLVSGHVYGRVQIVKIEMHANFHVFEFACPAEWTKYLFSKGYIALDGVSLTLVEVRPEGKFSVHLIPETLRFTTFGQRQEGAWVNIEFESQTQAIVETVERVLQENYSR